MRFLVLLSIGLLLISMIPTSVISEPIVHNSAPESCSITIALNFLNFDDRVNLGELDSYLPSTVDNTYTNFEITYEITQLSASINESVTDYWDANGPLMEHENVDFNPELFGSTTDVFVNKIGRTVDAREFEKWFSINTPEKTADYSFYLLNLTHLDDGYHHWFSLRTDDVDSNTSSTGFYSKTTNLKSKPVVGFGGSFDRSYFLDLSSYHWYPNWIETAWGTSLNSYINTSVQEIVEQEDINTTDGQDAIRAWLADWIKDIERNNFVEYVNPPMIIKGDGEPVINPTAEIEVLVLSNLTDYGYSLEEISWMTSEQRIEQPLRELAPFINWEANVRYELLSDYEELYERFNNESEEGDGVIEVTDGFFNYISSNLPILFPEGEGDIGFPTIVFITDDTAMSYYGTKFAGLGGMGWQLMNINPSRVYRLNETSNKYDIPDKGMSQVIIHEIGHSAGFGHTHSTYFGWAGDYVESVMSYYTVTSNFSEFEMAALRRTSTDNYFRYFDDLVAQINALIDTEGSPDGLSDKISQAIYYHTLALETYDSGDYLESYTNIGAAVIRLYEGKLLFEAIVVSELNSTFLFVVPAIICLNLSRHAVNYRIRKNQIKLL